MEYTEMTAWQSEYRYLNVQTTLFVINCVMKLIITINSTPSHAGLIQTDQNAIYGIAGLSPSHKWALRCCSRHVKLVGTKKYENKQEGTNTTNTTTTYLKESRVSCKSKS